MKVRVSADLNGFDVLEHFAPIPEAQRSEIPPGCLRYEGFAEPLDRNGYWELTYNFTLLPPMIGEGI